MIHNYYILGIDQSLIRKKKGAAPEERLRELKEHFLMQKIEKAIPGQLDKVFIVQGDSQEIGESSSYDFERFSSRSRHEIYYTL